MKKCQHKWLDFYKEYRVFICYNCCVELHLIQNLDGSFTFFQLDNSDPNFGRKLDELKKRKSYAFKRHDQNQKASAVSE